MQPFLHVSDFLFPKVSWTLNCFLIPPLIYDVLDYHSFSDDKDGGFSVGMNEESLAELCFLIYLKILPENYCLET